MPRPNPRSSAAHIGDSRHGTIYVVRTLHGSLAVTPVFAGLRSVASYHLCTPDIFHELDVDAENPMKLLRLITTAALLFSVGYLLDCKHAGGCRKKHGEEQLDDALDNTFPASDPTATQDFSIPANRM